MLANPSSHPLMTWPCPRVNLNGLSWLWFESNSSPFCRVPLYSAWTYCPFLGMSPSPSWWIIFVSLPSTSTTLFYSFFSSVIIYKSCFKYWYKYYDYSRISIQLAMGLELIRWIFYKESFVGLLDIYLWVYCTEDLLFIITLVVWRFKLNMLDLNLVSF